MNIIKTISVVIINTCVMLICIEIINKMYKSRGILSITPLSFILFKDFFVFCMIGSSIVYVGGGKNYYEYSFMNNDSTKFFVWISILYSVLFLFYTLYIIEKFSKRKTIKNIYFRISGLCKLKNKKAVAAFIVLFTLVSLIYYVFYCIRHGYFPIKSMFEMTSSQLSALRHSDKFFSTENTIIKNILLLMLPPITTYASYYCYKIEKTIFWKLLLINSFLVTSMCLTYRFEKSYLIYFLLGFILMPLLKDKKAIYTEDNKIKIKKIIIIGFIVIFGMIYVLFITGKDSFSILNLYLSMNRFIYGQIVGLYRHYDLFPNNIEFLNFKYFPTSVAYLFGNEEIRSARLVMLSSYPGTNQGYMNTLFLGEAYANGGIITALFAPIIVGIMIYLELTIFDMIKDDVFSRACLVYILLNSIPITC